ncbi:PREDICTED: serine/threonine-protein phosphatase 4 regulatory subunit 1-like [Chrysochloris asiatica]|uniref:Serine/threonine-protein phosphatase 4 regulatory subunit 1-like n=1 Tax=Chrysochloris asiatica TaxID=185453 RepID=A0A9B0WIT7_CHRAS|nr:PREDICTED: serine/threonine-protein phosphatase 4 regulatory subunit 1-like [Chrysochloris asiatica]
MQMKEAGVSEAWKGGGQSLFAKEIETSARACLASLSHVTGDMFPNLASSLAEPRGYGFEDYGPDCGSMRVTAFLDIPGQDNLPPLMRLEKYAFSDNIFNRQIIARGLLDIFRDFSSNEDDFLTVLELVVRLSEDAEPTVRTELMDQIPPIAMFLQEHRADFPTVLSEYLVPVVVRYLTDANNQVRKSSQEVLLILLEQDLIFQHDIENKVCPVLLHLSAPDSDDEYKTEAVNIICKMASMLSRNLVVRLLLPRFCDLCGDSKLFQVRKVCAAHFGDVCHAVGQEATEKFLIPKFFELCSDSVWGMRKACAECFMAVSCTTSPAVRRAMLSPLFIRLISDPCRWVRQAAFQSLGPFISTFANPSRAGLCVREDGTLSIRPPAEELHSGSPAPSPSGSVLPPPISRSLKTPVRIEADPPLEGTSSEASHELSTRSASNGSAGSPVQDSVVVVGDELARSSPGPCTFSKLSNANGLTTSSHLVPHSSACLESSADVFSNFLYWRTPLPDISRDLELLVGQAGPQEDACCPPETAHNSCVPSSDIQKVLHRLQEHMRNDPDVQDALAAARMLQSTVSVCPVPPPLTMKAAGFTIPAPVSHTSGYYLRALLATLDLGREKQQMDSEETLNGTHHPLQTELNHDSVSQEETKSKLQDIIPQPLLDQYVSMTDPARAQTVDTDIAKHCAYSLPGVALTLGRQNWHCLKDTYETLASDVQWKVRRTLAFSIHELAVILGDQLTAADLVPIFNGFLKDLDEVRIGVLKHLYDFLKLLHADKRREYLYQLPEFVVTDNSRNWRFRYELAEQLILILELYNPNDVYDYLMHIALKLCADKVSEVRWISFKLAVAILHKFYSNSESALGLQFINELILRFRHCPKWVGRQAFAFICQAVVNGECIPVDQFVEHLLPSLLSLASDPVPNVRVLLAKALRQTLLEKAYFRNAGNPHLEVVQETVLVLQSDRDQDVSFFATLEPKRQNILDTTMLEKQN